MLVIYLWHMYWSLWQVRKNIAERTKFVLFYAYKVKYKSPLPVNVTNYLCSSWLLQKLEFLLKGHL